MAKAPTNAAEWWALLVAARGNIERTMDLVGMTAMDKQRLDVAIGARHMRNAWRVLQETWTNAPDAAVIHTWPAWSVLCDLCSEGPHIMEQEKRT